MSDDTDRLEYLLDHYKYPRNYGTIENPDISHEEGNPSCGDVVRFDFKVSDNMVAQIRFSGKGCAISQASASILSEMIKDKSLDEIKEITMDDVLGELGIKLSPIRLKCALLPLKVVKAGVYGINEWPDEASSK
ncbi:MAG: iron-sulfur cluster assembly scaffold protein [Thermodesulfobacteriota bacterium]